MGTPDWIKLRETLRYKLLSELEEGLVDPDVIPLLSTLWSLGCVTSSSCSGRIAVKASNTTPWDKRGTIVLKAWHDAVEPHDLLSVVDRASRLYRVVWVSLEPPVITLYAPREDIAKAVVDEAIASGFKYSCYRRAGNHYYVVVRSETRLNIIASLDGVRTPISLIERVVDLLNEGLRRSKRMLNEFHARLQRLQSRGINTNVDAT